MANRPVVLVYQENANLGATTATPELNAAIIGPAYQIVDYPEDRLKLSVDGSMVPNVAAEYGALNSGAGVPTEPVVLAYTDKLTGAKADPASVKVYAESARALVAKSGVNAMPANVTTVAKSAAVTLTGVDAAAKGIRAGDWCILTDGAAADLVRRVREVSGETVTFTSEFPADGAWTNSATVTYQFERDVAAGEVPADSVTATADAVTVAAGFELGGLKVVYAQLFVAYRALRTDLALFNTMTDFRLNAKKELGKAGKLDARNPLCVGLSVAAKNTNTSLQYFGIESDDSDGYAAAKAALSSRKDIYAVALLTDDPSVVKSFGDSFMESADPDYALTNGVSQKFRVAIGHAGALPQVKLLVQKGTPDSVGAGTMSHAAGGFVDAFVIVNDLVRFYKADGTTDDRKVTAVPSNETLQFEGTAPTGVVAYDVVRSIAGNKDAQVAALVSLAASVANRRVLLCWPDLVEVTDLTDGSKARGADGLKTAADPQPGYYLACGVAAMTAALPSHQGFTNFAVNGIKRVFNANPYFSDKQITQLSNAGLFVFTQDDDAALPYIVHELTTDPSSLEYGEFMCIKNMDYVSMALKDVVDDFLGKWNVTEDTLDFVRAALQVEIDGLVLDKKAKIGARLRSGRITALNESDKSADRVEVFVEGKFPKPLNTIGLHVISG